MKRTILAKLALALGALTIGLAGVGQAKADVSPSALEVMTRCESNGITVAGIHGLYESPVSGNPARVYFTTYLMKYLPPNWVYTGRANGTWSNAAHRTALNTPVARDLIDLVPSQRFAISEPGTYFVWVLFAYPNGSGGYDYQWKYSNVCTIKGSVFAGPGAAKASKAKKAKAKKAVKIAPRPTKPPVGLG
jgi:hypothetical protein